MIFGTVAFESLFVDMCCLDLCAGSICTALQDVAHANTNRTVRAVIEFPIRRGFQVIRIDAPRSPLYIASLTPSRRKHRLLLHPPFSIMNHKVRVTNPFAKRVPRSAPSLASVCVSRSLYRLMQTSVPKSFLILDTRKSFHKREGRNLDGNRDNRSVGIPCLCCVVSA